MRHRRQNLVVGIEQKQTLRDAVEEGVGQPVAGAVGCLVLALPSLARDEHMAAGCQRLPGAELMAVTARTLAGHAMHLNGTGVTVCGSHRGLPAGSLSEYFA